MRTVRYGSFETNSSSTHAIVIPKNVDINKYDLNDSLERDYYFGRQESRLIEYWDEKLAYIYIVLKDHYIADLDTFKDRVIKIYNNIINEGHKPYFNLKPQDLFDAIDGKEPLKELSANNGELELKDSYNFVGNGYYVDHSYNIDDNLIDRILNDDEFLKRLIFNRQAYITIGGDEYRGYNIKTIGFEYDYDDEWVNDKLQGEFWNRLEEYEKENDVYLKGN